MSNVNAATTSWNLPNYVGELFLVGSNNKTPFLNMIGGLQGGAVRTVKDFEFPIALPWDLEGASQPDISETDSLTASDVWTYVPGRETNTVQIFQKKVSISYVKQSVSGQITAYDNTGVVMQGAQGMGDVKDFQIMAHLKQIAKDVNYTFLNGEHQQATSAAVAAKTRGIITACSSNTVDALSAALSKTLINELLREMAGNGAEFENPVIFVNAFQKQALSSLYGYAPEDRNVGGVNIKQIETDFAMIGVVYEPNVPAETLLLADLAVCRPVFLPVPGKGVLFYEELSKSGASEDGQIYGQIGLDYGPEAFHGTITSLATSAE